LAAQRSPLAESELLKVDAMTTPIADYERARRSGGAIRQLVAELRPENDAIQIDGSALGADPSRSSLAAPNGRHVPSIGGGCATETRREPVVG
jgi:hypothetical protein